MSAPVEPGPLERAQSVVALGGGHGLSATLRALRRLHADLVLDELTAVVTVADNGGSSGRLRGEFGVLPPGDLRMALAALCQDDDWGDTWAGVLQHRFAGDGEMNGHVVGNLLIVALWEQLGDHVRALDLVGDLLGAVGRVLPMALTPLDIRAEVRGIDAADPDAVTVVRGQVEVATTDGVIASVALEPADPTPCPEAIAAIADADWVVLGPGSWFTSVIPHLLVPAMRDALITTAASVILVLNLEQQDGETPGFSPGDHLAVLSEHAPDLKIHTVVADRAGVGNDLEELAHLVSAFGAQLVVDDVAMADGSARHDPERLAAVFERVMTAGVR
ncbi:uridine diphosphate-N-acetylglucosamine-binding protein YvcK [Nocardioides fonticola]|uniref:Putative gluconeogenesis factor n=1 Tax=Nocardioides fonticola TaxID=450363 RepID=A0ABP7XYF0_9ACTN